MSAEASKNVADKAAAAAAGVAAAAAMAAAAAAAAAAQMHTEDLTEEEEEEEELRGDHATEVSCPQDHSCDTLFVEPRDVCKMTGTSDPLL